MSLTIRRSAREGGSFWRYELRRHLAIALTVKAVVLVLLWLTWVSPYRVTVDGAAVGERLSSVSNATIIRENSHDRSVGR